ncbi:MAG TPA: toxin-activating lysine-acyltransferase [Thermodesulfobacteriota bacterium]|nr:toxin-activating lysine-acyltransferase [Thermodesulfobacteriota bacterium]
MEDIIKFYIQFNRYKKYTNVELSKHIEPCMKHNQYKRFDDDKGIFGFVSWAFLNEEAEELYKKKGLIKNDKWQSGNRLWLYDIVILRNARIVMSWVYNYFKDYLQTNQCINWLRLDDNNNIYRISKKYKREFHS